jgi:hypothetical protein
MSSEPSRQQQGDVLVNYDSAGCRVETRSVMRPDGSVVISAVWCPDPPVPAFTFAHDKQKGHFVLTWPDGRTERFRDNPVRHLVVEPDPETGEMRPVTRYRQPTYLYLSREEREL